jgi:hypothetical protein
MIPRELLFLISSSDQDEIFCEVLGVFMNKILIPLLVVVEKLWKLGDVNLMFQRGNKIGYLEDY